MVGRSLVMAAAAGSLLLSAAVARPSPLGPLHWTSYHDRGSGTLVEYPDNLFSEAGTPLQPGLGQTLRTVDGRASLTIYGLPNRGGDTALGYLRKHLAIGNRDLDYRRVTDHFFAISGIKHGQTFYSRCNFSAPPLKQMHCILMVYPARENRVWDDVVTRISLSLR